jgi:hypothetical protein
MLFFKTGLLTHIIEARQTMQREVQYQPQVGIQRVLYRFEYNEFYTGLNHPKTNLVLLIRSF